MVGNDSAIPTGCVTFLFSDVVGSTRLWASDPDGMSVSLQIHDHVLREAIVARSGYVFTTGGDSFAAAFASPTSAVDAALDIQSGLGTANWGSGPRLVVRIGVHRGEAEERGGDYFGPVVNTTARLEAAGHGGQTLITDAVRDSAGIEAVDLGQHRLRDIDMPIRVHQVGLGTFPALRDTGTVNLPIMRTALFGRDAAVVNVRKLLARHPLVTLTGVGGCGKTRLAIEIAHREIPDTPGGVWFIDLAPVMDPEGVLGAFAAALGLATDPFSPIEDQIATYLTPRAGLLVVDNCEHVVESVALLLDGVLRRCSEMRVLATSREELAIDGEIPWRVPSLTVGPDSSAVALFVDRARIASPELRTDDTSIRIVEEICKGLDGNPLAIELAAARARSLGLGEIRDRLDDRFRLLSGGMRSSRQHQATLEATVKWSYDLLGAEERLMLRRLAVFRGGFDLADVCSVVDVTDADALDTVDALVAKSLIEVRRDNEDRVRHHILETIRLFALARLSEEGEVATTRDRHLDHFHTDPAVLDWGAWQDIDTQWRVFREFDNFLVAATWAMERDRPDAAARLATVLYEALLERGEAGRVLTWLQSSAVLDRADQVRVLATAAYLRVNTFDVAGAETTSQAAIEAASGHNIDTVPWAYLLLSQSHMMQGDVERALGEARRALDLAQATPSHAFNRAFALLYRCLFHGIAGDFGSAVADADVAIAIAPGFAYRPLIEALRALALHLSNRDDDAERATFEFSEPSPTSAWAHANEIVSVIAISRRIGPDAATRRLAQLASEAVPRRPTAVGDWLTGFAYLALERGEAQRAREIITGALAPVLVGLEVEVQARVFAWPESERFDRYLTYLRENPAEERVGRALERQPGLFAAEAAEWA
jgi:predicted ATPase/class 3 adenylate cyclase